MNVDAQAEIGIIGGTGVYDQSLFDNVATLKMTTPYGAPSDSIEIGEYAGRRVAFLPRHGRGHVLPPHRVNYRANIWALKQLGVQRIFSPCAVGSLKTDYEPGHLVFPDQFIDFTKLRAYTFYDGGKTMHVSTADPFCSELRSLAATAADELNIDHHTTGTYICVEGPRFSTRAESKMFRSFADIIGMTLVPECQLAREMEMCYLSIAMITDYDVWSDTPVETKDVVETVAANQGHVKRILIELLENVPPEQSCACNSALQFAEI